MEGDRDWPVKYLPVDPDPPGQGAPLHGILNDAQYQLAKKELARLENKVKKGEATPEETERMYDGAEWVLIYEWYLEEKSIRSRRNSPERRQDYDRESEAPTIPSGVVLALPRNRRVSGVRMGASTVSAGETGQSVQGHPGSEKVQRRGVVARVTDEP